MEKPLCIATQAVTIFWCSRALYSSASAPTYNLLYTTDEPEDGAGLFLWTVADGATEEKTVPENETSVNLELVMTASRSRENVFRFPRSVSVVNRTGLKEKTPRTLSDALSDIPGVTIQKTTHGHGVPIIRGFIGRQNLILVDGIRLNNSIDNVPLSRIPPLNGNLGCRWRPSEKYLAGVSTPFTVPVSMLRAAMLP